MDALTGYRTIIVAVILGAIQVVNAVAPGTVLPDPAAVDTFVNVLLALLAPAAMVIMRLVTKTPTGGGP